MTDGKGVWIVAWFSDENLAGAGTDYDVFFSRSADDGETWSASQLLNSDATTDQGDFSAKDWRPVLMTDGEGNWVAAWNYYDSSTIDADISFARSTDNVQPGVTRRHSIPTPMKKLVRAMTTARRSCTAARICGLQRGTPGKTLTVQATVTRISFSRGQQTTERRGALNRP